LEALVRQYGLDTFQAAGAAVMDYAKRLMRQATLLLDSRVF
jgi:N-methylhydantoinase B/oxoprolinase/acetone carboxylase alpha subunit